MRETAPTVTLLLDDAVWQAALAHLEACLPNEGVGLISTRGERPLVRAVCFYPGRNLNESPSRFTMDPLDVLRACEDMERDGTRLGVVVHSHPRTSPEPSQTDLRELALPGVVNLIVQMRPQVWARAWEISPAGPAEVRIVAGEGRAV